ncbi:MAG: hypothetical protein AB7E37_01400 [Candidatus Altimarinota bacterium]
MKTNILSKLYTFVGLFIIYIAVMIFVTSTSENKMYKNPTNTIQKVSAELNFYQSTNNNTYENGLWSSQNYPIQTIYQKAKVSLTGEPTPVPRDISTVNITRHSH